MLRALKNTSSGLQFGVPPALCRPGVGPTLFEPQWTQTLSAVPGQMHSSTCILRQKHQLPCPAPWRRQRQFRRGGRVRDSQTQSRQRSWRKHSEAVCKGHNDVSTTMPGEKSSLGQPDTLTMKQEEPVCLGQEPVEVSTMMPGEEVC